MPNMKRMYTPDEIKAIAGGETPSSTSKTYDCTVTLNRGTGNPFTIHLITTLAPESVDRNLLKDYRFYSKYVKKVYFYTEHSEQAPEGYYECQVMFDHTIEQTSFVSVAAEILAWQWWMTVDVDDWTEVEDL